MRAADAAEKVTRKNRELLRPCKKELPGLLIETDEQELRWHLAVMIPRLVLNARERQIAADALKGFLEDRSSIVKTFALQGLTDLAVDDADMRPGVIEVLRQATRKGTPAMRARSRKLLFHAVSCRLSFSRAFPANPARVLGIYSGQSPDGSKGGL